MIDSKLAQNCLPHDITFVKKPYYHWLERAQLGQINCAVIQLPKKLNEHYLAQYLKTHPGFKNDLVLLPEVKTFESFDTRSVSQVSDLVKGKISSFHKNTFSELNQVISFYLNNDTQILVDQMGVYDVGVSLAREINPLFIEKQFDLKLAKEKLRLKHFTEFLGRDISRPNELLFCFVLLELIDNLLLLQTKHPQFKVLIKLEIEGQNYGLPIKDFYVYPAQKGQYFVQPQAENSEPILGACLVSPDTSDDLSLDSNKFFISTSFVDLNTAIFHALPQQGQNSHTKSALGLNGSSSPTLFASLAPSLATGSSDGFNFKLAQTTSIEIEGDNFIIKKHADLDTLIKQFHVESRALKYKINPIRVKPKNYGVNLHHFMDPGYECLYLTSWVEFEYLNKFYRVHNFNKSTSILLKMVAEGIVGLSDFDRQDLASGKRGAKRENDLRILKHQGLACLILLEASHHVLNRPLTSGQFDLTDEQFFDVLEKNIFDLLKRSAVVDRFSEPINFDKNLKTLLSDKVYAYVQFCLKEVLHLLRVKIQHFVVNEQIIELSEQDKLTSELILLIIEPLVLETRGELLAKANSKFLDFIVEFDKAQTFEQPLFSINEIEKELNHQQIQKLKVNDDHTSSYYSKLSELSLEGWNVFINSKPLEKLSEEDFKSEIQIKTSKLDWFELSPKLFFKGIEVNIEDINFSGKKNTKPSGVIFYQGRPYLIDPNSLPKFSALEKFWDRVKSENNAKGTSKEKEYVRVPKSQILELLALAEAGTNITSDNPYWDEVYTFYKNMGKPNSAIQLPSHLQEILKEHQKQGTQWIHDLYRLNLGGILADDMGLGKTLQVLTFLDLHKAQKNKTWSLIIVPTSLCFNWENEAKKFTPDLDIEIFSGLKKAELSEQANKKHKVLIATYGLLTEHEEFFTNILWDIIVFDEAQNLKNLSSKRTSSARLLKARFKLALSGTPLENNFMDFFSLADLTLPGAMGTYKSFQESFGPGKPINAEDVMHLKLKMRPIVLRRTKESVNLNLPRKLEESLHFDFTPKQIEIYKNLAISHNEQVNQMIKEKGAASSQLAMLTALLRLRQVCSDPSGIPNITFKEDAPKVSYIIECVKEHLEEGRSILIFTQFLATLNKLADHFTKQEIPFFSLHGAISGKNRREILDQFQNSDQPQVLLMTLKTGGVGLNLTKASVVYHIEPWWNPAVENQATDRSHRLGQTNEVQVFRLLMKDSVEEKIEQLKLKKKSYFDALFTDSESLDKVVSESGQLSADDFKFLLGM